MPVVGFSAVIPPSCLVFNEYDASSPTGKVKQTVALDASTVEIEERGVKLRLTVVDTPGFGDAIDNTDWYVTCAL